MSSDTSMPDTGRTVKVPTSLLLLFVEAVRCNVTSRSASTSTSGTIDSLPFTRKGLMIISQYTVEDLGSGGNGLLGDHEGCGWGTWVRVRRCRARKGWVLSNNHLGRVAVISRGGGACAWCSECICGSFTRRCARRRPFSILLSSPDTVPSNRSNRRNLIL